MNAFERHNIETLSPSKVMLFVSSPALFVLEHVMKRRQPVGTVAHRGAAVEAGVVFAFENPDATPDECAAHAEAFFDSRAALSTDRRREDHRADVGQMAKNAVAELRPYGTPTARQQRVAVNLEGLPVPIRGDFDFEWADHGILTDLKATDTIPSRIKTTHAWQVSLYLAGRNANYQGRVTYAGPAGPPKTLKNGEPSKVKRTPPAVSLILENPREHLNALHRAALTIGRFLAVSADPAELVAITAPDPDQYMLADRNTRQAVFDVWGY